MFFSPKIKNLHWLWLSVIVIILDQFTKHLAMIYLPYAQPQAVLPFFNLTLTHNMGAAFSFLNSAAGWQRWLFGGIAVIVSMVIFVWLYRLPKTDHGLAFALSLILGGAFGNLYDRIAYGYVIDFIDIYYKYWHWPVFNLADSAICIGGVMLIISLLRK